MSRNQAGSSWIAKAIVFSLSSTLAGLVGGAILGTVGSVLPYDLRIALACLFAIPAIVLGAIELVGHRLRLLQCDRETPQAWVRLGPLRWAMLNGIALGSGGWSRIGFWLWYTVPIGALLVGNPALSAALFGTYSFVRGAAVWVIVFGVVRRRAGYARWLLGGAKVARSVTAGLLVLVGTVVIATIAF